MKMTDDILSAFLDNELSEAEMQNVREAIAADNELTARLAELAAADDLFRNHAAMIDDRPMPPDVLTMLNDKVVELSAWRRLRSKTRTVLSEYASLAAGIALVVGFAGGQIIGTPGADNVSDAGLAAALSQTPSGQAVLLPDGRQLTSNFSFLDQQQRLCRQFILISEQENSSNIACRDSGNWQLQASVYNHHATGADYQPASRNEWIDQLLDELMVGQPMSLEQEQAALSD